MKISYNWLKRYIKEIPKEEDLVNLITFKICELESVEKSPNGDTVFDMKILPDRAHDLLSHYGVAKEIAGILGINITEIDQNIHSESTNISLLGNNSLRPSRPAQGSPEEHSASLTSGFEDLKIDVESPLCRRYMGRIIRDIEIGESPLWMKELLESVGQRSINNIVDITNFILFDKGQPIHAFDLDKLESEKLIVRNAKIGEKINLLSYENLGKERIVELSENNLIIADEKDPVAIAGVKGGTKAEVDKNTKNILIEVANFDPVSVRKTARGFGIQTDAVKRFENEIIPDWCSPVMNEVSSLILETCENAKLENIVDLYNEKKEERKITFNRGYISKVLGVEIKNEEIEKILKNYNYKYNFLHKSDLCEVDMWEMVVPKERLDISGGHDMAEEIGRVYGYDKIASVLPDLKLNHKDSDTWTKICLAKNKLVEDGYKEVMTYALVEKGEVEIMASASDKNFLRTNLLDGLNKSYELNRLNAPFLEMPEIKIFEVGTVFTKDGEEMRVAYVDKKNKIEMSLDKFIEKEFSSDFLREKALPLESPRQGLEEQKTFKLWSNYPFITRDVAVWVSTEKDGEELYKILKENGGELLIKDPYLFDKFTKGEKTSYAYRLIFQSYDRTLNDDEINEILNRIYEKIKLNGWEIR
ncbi:TPA: phenylalanine--tRNA ligase subunit beta [Candidatus Nomurabacteria bacterium]|nr:MAG: Phenylalanine-tRNA ligase beta subunit [Parcubacteria bacterium RAAC4_OD1_1]HCY26549.1 phenylalanine--tRNA ligase subunit beta [Candidatus Nomurabacteria bacterium]